MQVIDLQYVPIGVNPVIHVSQYDVGRQFQLKIYDGSTAYSMPNDTTARIDGLKPDGTAFSYTDAVSVSGNVVTVTTKDQMTVLSGAVICEIRFSDSSLNDIGTLNFKLEVEKSPIDNDIPISDTEIPAIIDLARTHMLNAEAWAVGTKNGVDVGSDAPQYHSNSKYWSDESADSATASANSATAASGSADAASGSATASANSATLSQSWAVGGTNTRQGEDTNNSKHFSEDAEAWAVGKRGGVDVETTDRTYQNNSKYYSDQSRASAGNAFTSEQNAKLSEQNAKASEDILDYYVDFVIPRFVIANNRLYVSDAARGEFIVANNRLYIKNAS